MVELIKELTDTSKVYLPLLEDWNYPQEQLFTTIIRTEINELCEDLGVCSGLQQDILWDWNRVGHALTPVFSENNLEKVHQLLFVLYWLLHMFHDCLNHPFRLHYLSCCFLLGIAVFLIFSLEDHPSHGQSQVVRVLNKHTQNTDIRLSFIGVVTLTINLFLKAVLKGI